MSVYDAVALFSGGLDSILAIRLIEEQGIKVKCLHFVSPFFGRPDRLACWRRRFGLDVEGVDVGEDMARLLREGPAHGFGKALNPCVDCKILMLRAAARRMPDFGARFIVSGEVLGQRPMSQRRDALHLILKEAGVKELLVRPLSAKLMPPSAAELSGLVDRERLLGIRGRGRKEQLALAARFALPEIPAPAGGCRLTERENALRYWSVLRRAPEPGAAEFYLADCGRRFWSHRGEGPYGLSIGRKEADNAELARRAFADDIFFKLADLPGPLGVGRQFPGRSWPDEAVRDAAAFVASFSPRALRLEEVRIRVRIHGREREERVAPARGTPLAWGERDWETARGEIRARQKAKEREALP